MAFLLNKNWLPIEAHFVEQGSVTLQHKLHFIFGLAAERVLQLMVVFFISFGVVHRRADVSQVALQLLTGLIDVSDLLLDAAEDRLVLLEELFDSTFFALQK